MRFASATRAAGGRAHDEPSDRRRKRCRHAKPLSNMQAGAVLASVPG
jgi:hypothetical protein